MGDLKEFVKTRIEEEIKIKNLKYVDLAKKMGKDKVWIHRKLKGKSPINLKEVELFALALGIHWSDLIPTNMKYNIEKMPFHELIKNICREEITEIMKENGIIIKK